MTQYLTMQKEMGGCGKAVFINWGNEPPDDLYSATTAEQRLEILAVLTERACSLTGLPYPEYERHEMPVKVLRIWVQPTESSADRVWEALVRFGAPLTDLGIHREDFSERGMVVQSGLPPRRVGLMTDTSGVSNFATAYRNREVRGIARVVELVHKRVATGGHT